MITNQPSLGPINLGIIYIRREKRLSWVARAWAFIKKVALYEVW